MPDAADGTAGAVLDLHEGIVDPPRIEDPRTGGCLRWPEGLWLLAQETGEVVVGRCKATNLCPYCQALYVLETSEMLQLDAMEYAPTLWAVLTAREHLTRADCRRHLEQLRRAAKKRWEGIEWHVQVELQKRGALHLNLLIKGVPVEEGDELLELLVSRWCKRVDALPVGQSIQPVNDAGGLTRYLQKSLSHGLKREQAPPIGWKGHRTSQTRGYLVRPASVMREEARRALRLKRAIRRARLAGHEGHEAELVAHEAIELADSLTWRLYHQSFPSKSPPTVGADFLTHPATRVGVGKELDESRSHREVPRRGQAPGTPTKGQSSPGVEVQLAARPPGEPAARPSAGGRRRLAVASAPRAP